MPGPAQVTVTRLRGRFRKPGVSVHGHRAIAASGCPRDEMNASFRVETDELQDVTALRVIGELDQATLPALHSKLDPLLEAGTGSLLVDLSDCEFIDSTGLTAFVTAHERLATQPGRLLGICCPDKQVRRLLELTGLDRAMDIADSRDAALTALRDGVSADRA